MNRPSHYYNKFGIHYRFGFDPKTDDYKIVKLSHGLLQPNVSSEWKQVEVYSIRKGSREFIIEKVPPHITRIFDQDEVCMDGYNGYIHWLGAINEKNLQTIVAFDLSGETFSEISLPDSIKHFDKKLSCVLGIKGGKLCVMPSVKEGDDGCDVWVMNRYKVAESWEKHRISLTLKFRMNPIGFTFNNEFIFEIERSHFALYDPTTNTEKLFNIEYHANARGSTKIVQYVDSLVWELKNLHSMGTSLDRRLWKRLKGW
ncbi:F-box/kelch-repeat protein-like protein [Tanacetum coccineum]